MNVKTMEGLAGASASVNMLSTPMNVAKEAERKGDVDKMQRALGYAAGVVEQADAYSEKTSKGMELDAKETKKEREEQQEELIEARRAQRQEQAGQTGQAQEAGAGKVAGKTESADVDQVEISQEGKELAQADGQTIPHGMDGVQDATYGSSGEILGAVMAAGGNMDVSA